MKTNGIMGNSIIKVSGIVKSFPEKRRLLNVLNGVYAEVEAGEMVSITGVSGAGKTTLLQIIGGIDFPDQGDVFINGVNLSGLVRNKRAAFQNSEIGFVFQFHHLLPELSALENIMMPGLIKGNTKAENYSRGIELLKLIGVLDRKDHLPSELSGGERQRVAFARALFNSPAVVLADEPTGNLDPENTEKLLDLIKSVNKEFGQTFVIATHDTSFKRIVHRSLTIKEGEIV